MAAMEETCPICSGPRHVANFEELARLHAVNAQMLEALRDVRGWVNGLSQLDDDPLIVEGAFKQLPILDAALAAAEPETEQS